MLSSAERPRKFRMEARKDFFSDVLFSALSSVGACVSADAKVSFSTATVVSLLTDASVCFSFSVSLLSVSASVSVPSAVSVSVSADTISSVSAEVPSAAYALIVSRSETPSLIAVPTFSAFPNRSRSGTVMLSSSSSSASESVALEGVAKEPVRNLTASRIFSLKALKPVFSKP